MPVPAEIADLAEVGEGSAFKVGITISIDTVSSAPSQSIPAPSSAPVRGPGTPGSDWAAWYAAAQKYLSPIDPSVPAPWEPLCQIYLKMGLIAPARHLVGHHAEALDESHRLLKKVWNAQTELPDNAATWQAYQGRYLRNLHVLTDRYPDLKVWLNGWNEAQSQFALYRLADGNYQIARTQTGQPCTWCPALRDHRGEQLQRPMAHDAKALMPPPYLFHGLGFGWFVRRLHETTRNTFLNFSPAIYIVETDPVALAMSLHLHDWQEFFGDPRVYLVYGDEPQRDLERLWARQDGLPLAGYCVENSLSPHASTRDWVETVRRSMERRRRLQVRSARQTERHYRQRDVHYWAERFSNALAGRGAPLRILAPVSRQTTFLKYSVRDASEAFARLGHDCHVLMEESDHHLVSLPACHRAIRNHQADLLLVMDHLRTGTLQSVPRALPLFTWDQDLLPHAMTRQAVAGMGPFDLLAGASKYHYASKLGCDPSRICFAVIPTNPNAFSAEPISPQDRERYGCDVSYVSTASQTPEVFHAEELRRSADPNYHRLLDGVYQLTKNAFLEGANILGPAGHWILTQAEAKSGVYVREPGERDRLLKWYLWRLTDRLFRHQALEWTARWATETGRRFHLYGQGWESHETLGRFARGPAQNGHELRCIYQASTINLQLMPAGFIHQRALDGLATGGFFLTRQTPADHVGVLAGRILAQFEMDAGQAEAGAGPSPQLTALMDEYQSTAGVRHDPKNPDDRLNLQCSADHDAAARVFPGFSSIEFAGEAQFRERAERFMRAPDDRQTTVETMRRVVLERYTYDKTMLKFLEFARDYFVSQVEQGRQAPQGAAGHDP